MGELQYYQLIPRRRAEYSEAPGEISVAAEEAYGRAYDETMEAYHAETDRRKKHGIGEADADAHLDGVAAANNVWETWYLAQLVDKRDLTYELDQIPAQQVVLLENVNDALLELLALARRHRERHSRRPRRGENHVRGGRRRCSERLHDEWQETPRRKGVAD